MLAATSFLGFACSDSGATLDAGGSTGVTSPRESSISAGLSSGTSVTEVASSTSAQSTAAQTTPSGLATTAQTSSSPGRTTNAPNATTSAPSVKTPPNGSPTPTQTTAVVRTVPSAPQAQRITFPAPAGGRTKYAVGRSVPLSASATSRLAVSYAVVDNPQICQIAGAAVRLTSVGPCTIEARQGGNATWLPAPPVRATFQIVNGDSSFSLSGPSSGLAGSTVNMSLSSIIGSTAFYVSTTTNCSQASDVSVSGSSGSFQVSLDQAGACGITVDQSGDQLFNIGQPRTATINVTAPPTPVT